MHHHRGRQLDRAAGRQLAHGNFGAAAVLHGAAVNQHMHAGLHHHHSIFDHHHHHHHHGYHPLVWNPWLATNWMVRRSIRREMVRRSCVVPITAGVPIHSTVIVMNPQQQLVVLPAGASFVACAQHQVQDLGELVEVIFEQEGRRTTLYADRKCIKCGQFFFCYSSDAPAPYALPTQPTVVPPPVQQQQYPPAGYPPAAASPYPAAQQPYPPAAASPYPPAAASPYPAAQQPYPPTAQQPYPPAAQQPYPPAAQQPYPPAAQQPYPPAAASPYPANPPPYAVNPPRTDSKICLKCSNASQANAVFCGSCGSKFPVYCGGCGQTAMENAKFCGHCGKGL